MRFLGSQEEFTRLKEVNENILDALLMDNFNAGFNSCMKSFQEQYEQAESAIKQNLVGAVPAENNPFIQLLELYKNSLSDLDEN